MLTAINTFGVFVPSSLAPRGRLRRSHIIGCRDSSRCSPPSMAMQRPSAAIGSTGSAAQDPPRHADRLSLSHFDDLQPAAGSDIVPADILTVHLDDQHPRVGDLIAVESTVVSRFAVAENHRKRHP